MGRYFTNLKRLQTAVYWCAGGLFGVSCLPHVFPSWIEQWMRAEGVDTPVELQAHVEKVAAAMHLPRSMNLRVFITSGFSSVNGGSTMMSGGAVIGLPRSVLFQSTEDVRKAGITFAGKQVDWNSEQGQELMEIVTPSAKQINFSIAHEVAHIQYLDFLLQAMFVSACLIASCWLARFLVFVTTPGSHDSLVLLSLACGPLFCWYARPMLSHWQEFRADRRAALTHKSYCQGGKEMMSKRIALDELTVSCTGTGEQQHHQTSWTDTHPSFYDRLRRLEQLHYAASE